MLTQLLTVGAAILDIDVTRAKLPHVVPLSHDIAFQDAVTTIALQAGLHSVVNLLTAARDSGTRKPVRGRSRHGTIQALCTHGETHANITYAYYTIRSEPVSRFANSHRGARQRSGKVGASHASGHEMLDEA